MARAGTRVLDAGERLPALGSTARSEHSLTFPLGYGLPLKETAAALGAFYEERRNILQSTGFVVRPDRTIVVSQYSSGPIGRLIWQDVLGLVQFYKKSPK